MDAVIVDLAEERSRRELAALGWEAAEQLGGWRVRRLVDGRVAAWFHARDLADAVKIVRRGGLAHFGWCGVPIHVLVSQAPDDAVAVPVVRLKR